MGRDANATRERLIDAAEAIFARNGIEHANLREINRGAGQSNNSALHYHFGNREDLLQAVLNRHRIEIDRDRRELIENLSGTVPSVCDLLVPAVWPLGYRLESESGRNYLQIMVHLRRRSGMRSHRTMNPESSTDLQWVYRELDRRLIHLPQPLRTERLAVWIDMSVAAMASRAEETRQGTPSELDNNAFLINLIDMGGAALGAPSRLHTSQLADPH